MYTPRYPDTLTTRPLPYPLLQQPMVLRPAMGLWTDTDWDDDDMFGIVPLPRSRYVIAAAVFGATAMAVAGRSTVRDLLVGASSGIVASMAVSAVTSRD